MKEIYSAINTTIQKKKIEEFKVAICNENNSLEKIIDKYLLFGTPYIFKDYEDGFYELKHEVADFFSVSQTNVFVVGSAKLGFSIAPQKNYKFFNEDSDIDIAIIDKDVFLRYWKMLYNYNITCRAWSTDESKNYNCFLKYFFKGWLRPDKFPSRIDEKNQWFDFFKTLHTKYGFKISAGIYYDIDVFNGYNIENLNRIKNEIKEDNIK